MLERHSAIETDFSRNHMSSFNHLILYAYSVLILLLVVQLFAQLP